MITWNILPVDSLSLSISERFADPRVSMESEATAADHPSHSHRPRQVVAIPVSYLGTSL